MVHNSTLFTLKTLCVCVSLLESLVMTWVICHNSSHSLTRVTCNDSSHFFITRVNMQSSQSQVRVISQVTRVKSSHVGEISSQVKSSQKLWLESESVTWLVTGLELIQGHPRPWPLMPSEVALMPFQIFVHLRPKISALFACGLGALL